MSFQINAKLDELAAAHASKGRSGVEPVLMDLLKSMSNVAQKWIVRIILKEVKVGVGQDTLLKK